MLELILIGNGLMSNGKGAKRHSFDSWNMQQWRRSL